jgi:adenylate cyclase
VEIERKFLVDVARWKPRDAGVHFEQGYLNSQAERVVRVRIEGHSHLALTQDDYARRSRDAARAPGRDVASAPVLRAPPRLPSRCPKPPRPQSRSRWSFLSC